MSDYDRGPYTPPSEPPLAFDARRPQRGGRGPAPVTLIVSVLVLVIAAGGAFFIYRGGVRGASDAPQPVGAPVRDVKAAPPPEAQPQDPAAGLSVYKDSKGAAAAPTFTQPPEAPGPRPAPQAANVPPPPAPPPAATPAAPKAPARPATIASILDHTAPPPPLRPAAAPPPPPAKPAAPVAKPSAPGGSFVQIGAFSSRALADAEWKAAARIAPAAMAGKGEHVEPVSKDGGAIVYRTTVTGFASRTEADALCGQLRAAGKSCFAR